MFLKKPDPSGNEYHPIADDDQEDNDVTSNAPGGTGLSKDDKNLPWYPSTFEKQ